MDRDLASRVGYAIHTHFSSRSWWNQTPWSTYENRLDEVFGDPPVEHAMADWQIRRQIAQEVN